MDVRHMSKLCPWQQQSARWGETSSGKSERRTLKLAANNHNICSSLKVTTIKKGLLDKEKTDMSHFHHHGRSGDLVLNLLCWAELSWTELRCVVKWWNHCHLFANRCSWVTGCRMSQQTLFVSTPCVIYGSLDLHLRRDAVPPPLFCVTWREDSELHCRGVEESFCASVCS